MIKSLRLKGFKSFEDSGEIMFQPLTLLIGANATGKSNLRDALRLLHGVGLGYSAVEIEHLTARLAACAAGIEPAEDIYTE